MLEIGSKLGNMYTVLAEIGKGGTSHVYLVLNERAGKQWAAKEVEKEGGGEQGVIRRGLVADAEILKKLRHPHIPNIVDVLETQDTYYILMEYIEGINLLDVLRAEGAQDQEKAVKWIRQICDVLNYLHNQTPKIIYRDTKPQNIMLKPDGDVVLIDFGSAREYKKFQTSDTISLGSRGYAAPEQYGGMGQTDERTDVFNVGATMYHLLTGHDPTQYPYELYPIRKWNSALSPELERIVLKCTMQNPDERYQSMPDLLYDLERYQAVDSGLYSKRKKRLVAAGACAVLGIGMIIGGSYAGRASQAALQSGYDGIMKKAQFATTKEEQMDYYAEAIRLRPAESAPYLDLLADSFLADDNFSREEASYMTKLLAEANGDRANEEWFSGSEEYGRFAYQMGLAYFYYYDENGNKPLAQPWFETAAKRGGLTEAQATRVQILERISSYYRLLGQYDRAGDAGSSYVQYWEDLSTLVSGNIVEADNAKTAIVTEREMVYQILMHTSEFYKSGIRAEEMSSALERIEEKIRTEFSDADRENYASEIQELSDMIGKAKEAVNLLGKGDV